MVDTQSILQEITDELDRAEKKHGSHEKHPKWTLDRWMLILGEEYGEAVKEAVDLGAFIDEPRYRLEIEEGVLDSRFQHLYDELIQTGAMAVKVCQWLRWRGYVR